MHIPLLYHCDSDVGSGRGGRNVAAIVKRPIATVVSSISFSCLILIVGPYTLEFTWLFNPISPNWHMITSVSLARLGLLHFRIATEHSWRPGISPYRRTGCQFSQQRLIALPYLKVLHLLISRIYDMRWANNLPSAFNNNMCFHTWIPPSGFFNPWRLLLTTCAVQPAWRVPKLP